MTQPNPGNESNFPDIKKYIGTFFGFDASEFEVEVSEDAVVPVHDSQTIVVSFEDKKIMVHPLVKTSMEAMSNNVWKETFLKLTNQTNTLEN